MRLTLRIEFTDKDEQAILESCLLDDEEDPRIRRGICREYLENHVAAMLSRLRAWEGE